MKIASFMIGLALIAAIACPSIRAQAGDVFQSGGATGSSGNTTGRTGTQGIEGNPDCPPPVINGIHTKELVVQNWNTGGARIAARRQQLRR